MRWLISLAAYLLERVREGEVIEPYSMDKSVPEERCLFCDVDLTGSPYFGRYRVCGNCGFHHYISCWRRIGLITDRGSFRELDIRPSFPFPLPSPYREILRKTREETSLYESVVAGVGLVNGIKTVIIATDFSFLGGSIGHIAGEVIGRAFEYATRKKLPVIALISSSGGRAYEGALSLLQSARISFYISRFSEKGLPYISVLGNPSTGEVFSSFANMADIKIAEPGALLGVYPKKLMPKAREESHSAEYHLKRGLIDSIVERERLKDTLSKLLELLTPGFSISMEGRMEREFPKGTGYTIELARIPQRPSSSEYIFRMTRDFFEIRGDGMGGEDEGVICGIGEIGTQRFVIIGHEKRRIKPEGFRKAQRAMKLAQKFGLPLITLVDTPGPSIEPEDEGKGLGKAIADTITLMTSLRVPIISVIIGEGGGEGALPFIIADKVLIFENAYLSPFPPERLSYLLGETYLSQETIRELKISPPELLEIGLVDEIIPEPRGGTQMNPEEASRILRREILRNLIFLKTISKDKLPSMRGKKFRDIGRRGRIRDIILRFKK